MMNIDFHTHGKISKKVSFSLEYFSEMVNAAKKNGLDAFALTEHFNTHQFFDVYDTLDKEFPYVHDYYDVNGVKVFPGMEVDIQEKGHILFIGSREDIRGLRLKLNPYTEKNHFIPFHTLLAEASEFNFIKIGAHPFRESTPLHHIDRELLTKLDAFDLNGKDLFEQGISVNTEKVFPFAKMLGIPVVGGSDTHQFMQYGSIINRLEEECHTISDIQHLIAEDRYQIDISPELYIKVESAQKIKEVLKASMEKAV